MFSKKIIVLMGLCSYISANAQHQNTSIDSVAIEEIAIDNTQKAKKAPSKIINSQKIDHNSFQSLGNLLNNQPGMATLKSGNGISKPIINGLHSNRVLIFNQNVRQEDQQWGLEHAPNIDINSSENIKIYRGSNTLQFGGDAIGGVIVLENKPAYLQDTIFGKSIIAAQSNGRGFTTTSQINHHFKSGWFYKFQGSFKYLGDMQAPNYRLSNTGNREKNFSAHFGFQKEHYKLEATLSYFDAEIGILKSSHIGNLVDLIQAINGDKPNIINPFSYHIDAPKQQLKHYLGKINMEHYFKNGSTLKTQYSIQMNDRFEFDIRRNNNNNKPAVDLNLVTHQLNASLHYPIGQASQLIMGSQNSFQNNIANHNTGVSPLIPNYDKIDLGVFAITNLFISDKTTADFGLRYDYSNINASKFYLKSRWTERGYHPNFNHFIVGDYNNQWKTNPDFKFNNIAASAGITQVFSKDFTTNLSWNFNNRNPNPSELFSDGLHHATGQIELGNLNLQKETSNKLILNLDYSNSKFQFNIAPYYNHISNYIYLQPFGVEQNTRGVFPVWQYQQTNALLYGFDTDLTYYFAPNWSLQSSFSLLRGEDISNNEALIDMPSNQWRNNIAYQFKKWNNLKIELQNQIVFTQKKFPNNDFWVEVPQQGEFKKQLLQISQPPKGYQLFDLNLRMDVIKQTKIKGEIGLIIQNLANKSYRDYLNKHRFYADEMGRNIILQFKLTY